MEIFWNPITGYSAQYYCQIIEYQKKSLEKNLLFKIKIINYVKNKGKGYAIKKGFIKSSGKFLLICDADLSTPLTELTKLFRYTNDFDLIIGSRKQKDAKIIKRQSFIRTTLGKSYSWISKILLNVNAVMLRTKPPFRWTSGILAPIYTDNRLLDWVWIRSFNRPIAPT